VRSLEAAASANRWLWSFRRLWVAVISRQSERHGRSSTALKSVDPSVEVRVGEDRLDNTDP
jgi:hypothetical protein